VPSWLQELVGVDYFHDVTWVRIEGAEFGDAELKRLKPLDRIESIGIVETAITDEGLRHLRGSKHLKGLWLSGNWIGDRGIDNLDLDSLSKLEVIDLSLTLVSHGKLDEIKRRFPKLMVLGDNGSHRIIAPGEARGDNRFLKPRQDEPGGRRELPPRRPRGAD